GEPFFGGTYFPPEPRHGLASFKEVLRAVAQAWRERRADIQRDAGAITEALRRDVEPSSEPRTSALLTGGVRVPRRQPAAATAALRPGRRRPSPRSGAGDDRVHAERASPPRRRLRLSAGRRHRRRRRAHLHVDGGRRRPARAHASFRARSLHHSRRARPGDACTPVRGTLAPRAAAT